MSAVISREQLEALYLRHERALYNIVYRWVWNEAEAQDIVQEVFVRLWCRREQIRFDGAEPYAYRTAVNLAASRRRRMRLLQWLSLEEEHELWSEQEDLPLGLQRNEERQKLMRALDKLPQKLKQTLLLCEFSEYSYEQVGRILGVPTGTIGSRRNKALQRLQEILGHAGLSDKR